MNSNMIPRPASPDEAGLFYARAPEQDAELGCIGHVRMDFGPGGTRFWHTWHPRGPEEWNTPEFKAELSEVVDALRENVLQGLSAMRSYCLRCNPIPSDYQTYLTCYDKQVQEMNQDVWEKTQRCPCIGCGYRLTPPELVQQMNLTMGGMS